MSRLIWMLMIAGLFAAAGCEQKPVDRPPVKVAPANVRRDADQPVKTISAFAERVKEEPQVKLAPRPPEPTREPERARKPERAQTPDRPQAKVAAKEVRRAVSPVVESTSVYSKQDRKVFQKKIESQIDEMDGKLSSLREKGRNLKGTAKADWDQMMAELDVKRDAVQTKLDKLVHANEGVWDETKIEVESAWKDLGIAFREAWKKF
jgi:hypothetical protein